MREIEIAKDRDFAFWDELVRFCQRLIQTPSLSGREGQVALLIQEEMKKLKYDEIWTDRVGNVIGLLKGNSAMPSMCFTGHMDTVPLGDESKWEYPPYSGTIIDGYIHGRGASDMKGPLATQVYIPAVLREYALEHGNVYVIEVVQEENGGLGSMYLDESVKKEIDYAVIGEPTTGTNTIYIGQKGRIELIITFEGKSAHPALPWLGINPLYDMAKFILRLENMKMESYGELKSTVVPTICKTDTETSNVIPGKCQLTLDCRNAVGESEAQTMNKIKSILTGSSDVNIPEYKLKTYTGISFILKRNKPPFSIAEDHPLVSALADALRSTLNRKVKMCWWGGATDGGYFAEAGIPVVGFSPADEKYDHTNRERVSLESIKEAMKCYPSIISNISKLEKRLMTC